MEYVIPILLIATGFALILIEVYLVPGFNVIGILGALMIVFAIGYVYSESGLVGGTVALAGALTGGGLLGYVLWSSGAWNRFILATNLRKDEGERAREHAHRARHLGKSGVALTPLRPTGIVEVEGERIEVVTEGEFIAAGSQVRVVAMDRRRYFARLDAAAGQ